MLKKAKLMICMLLVMVMCSACTNSNVQVIISDNGITTVTTETLMEKVAMERLVIAMDQIITIQYGPDQAEHMAEELQKEIAAMEQVTIEGVEYYRKINEKQFQSYKEAEDTVKSQLSAGQMSIGEDHMYIAYYVNEQMEQADVEMLSQYEDYINMYGFTLEEAQQYLTSSKVNVRVNFSKPVTYTNGIISEDGTQVSWSFTQEDINTLQKGLRVFYAETTAESRILGDQVLPKISGIKKNGYYKNAQFEVSDDVEVAAVVINGMAADPSSDGFVVSQEGKNVVEVYDYNNNMTTCSFVVDTTKPKVKGVANNKTYKGKRKITFSDKYGIKTAKLNGKNIKNSKVVSKKGSYTLKVTDKAGNTTMVKFKIKK